MIRGAISTYISLGLAVCLLVHLGGVFEEQNARLALCTTKDVMIGQIARTGGGDAYAAGDVFCPKYGGLVEFRQRMAWVGRDFFCQRSESL